MYKLAYIFTPWLPRYFPCAAFYAGWSGARLEFWQFWRATYFLNLINLALMKRDESSGVSREFGERVIKTDRGICDDGRAIYQARCGALAVLLKVCPSKIKMLKKQTEYNR